MGDMIFNPWTGEWEVLNPSKTSTTATNKATGFDWLNAILTGAGNILGGLFPNGVNNGDSTNSGIPGGYFPTNQQSSTSQNNNTMCLFLGLILVVLLTKK